MEVASPSSTKWDDKHVDHPLRCKHCDPKPRPRCTRRTGGMCAIIGGIIFAVLSISHYVFNYDLELGEPEPGAETGAASGSEEFVGLLQASARLSDLTQQPHGAGAVCRHTGLRQI